MIRSSDLNQLIKVNYYVYKSLLSGSNLTTVYDLNSLYSLYICAYGNL